MTNKIVVIRGNSGSGKTTVAKELCKQLGKDCMLLSQDVIRRDVLHTNDGADSVAIELLSKLVLFGKEHSNIVILEGILNSNWYKPLFDTIQKTFQRFIHTIMTFRLTKQLNDLKRKIMLILPKKI